MAELTAADRGTCCGASRWHARRSTPATSRSAPCSSTPDGTALAEGRNRVVETGRRDAAPEFELARWARRT
jgi:hypothetical protein